MRTHNIYDAAYSWQLGFQDSASKTMEGIINLHHTLLSYGVFILVFVGYVLYMTIKYALGKFPDNTVIAGAALFLEIVWTITPSILLFVIALPSYMLLYLSEGPAHDPQVTMKVIGHQWYWSYEYSDYAIETEKEYPDISINFDSYMVSSDELEEGQFRLLEVDQRITLPTKALVRILCTSADVLHSWAVPSLGAKMDAVPGRLNEIVTEIVREGTFYGQCSELCGVNHGFMPIVVQGVPLSEYCEYVYMALREAYDEHLEELEEEECLFEFIPGTNSALNLLKKVPTLCEITKYTYTYEKPLLKAIAFGATLGSFLIWMDYSAHCQQFININAPYTPYTLKI